ncbi:unnamed protein product [Dicrocoelium dendriticum]|nr:unnamed protein product [Dicrocoelium dendriticum]
MCVEKSCALTAATDRVSELSAELSVVRQHVCEVRSENESLRVEIAVARAECEELRSRIDVGVRDGAQSEVGLIWSSGRVDVTSLERVDVSTEVCVARSVVCESAPCSSSTLVGLPGGVCSDVDARADVSVVDVHESALFSKYVEHVSSQTDEDSVLDGSISYGTVIGVVARDAGVGPDMADVCEPKSALSVEMDVAASVVSSGRLDVLGIGVGGELPPPPPPCPVQFGQELRVSSVDVCGGIGVDGVSDELTVDGDGWRAELVSRDERISVLSQLVDARDAALRDSRYLLSEKDSELMLLRQAQSRGDELRAALESELERVKCDLEAKCSELEDASRRLLLLDESETLGGGVSGRYEVMLESGATEDAATGIVCKGVQTEADVICRLQAELTSLRLEHLHLREACERARGSETGGMISEIELFTGLRSVTMDGPALAIEDKASALSVAEDASARVGFAVDALHEREVSESLLVVDELAAGDRLLSLPSPMVGTRAEDVVEIDGSGMSGDLWSWDGVVEMEHRPDDVMAGGHDVGVQSVDVGCWIPVTVSSAGGVMGSATSSGPIVVDASVTYSGVVCTSEAVLDGTSLCGVEARELSAVETRLSAALEKIEQLECEKCELQSELLSRSQVADRGRLLDKTVVDLVDAKKLLGELVGQLSELRASYVHGLSERASLESTLRDALCNLTDVELQLSVNTRHGEELRDALTESEMACAEARAAASRQACDLLEVMDRLKCSELAREALSVRVADQQKVLVCMAGELRHVRDVLCGVGAELRTLGLECKRWQSSGASELGQCVCTVDSLVETSQKLYSESASRLIEMESLVCDLREELRVACAPVCASEGALREELCALRSEYARVCEAVASSEAMCVEKSCALTAATDRVSELSAELCVVQRRVRELSSEKEALLSELFDASTHFAEFSSLLSMFCPCLSSSILDCLLPLDHPSNDGYRGVFSPLLRSSECCFFRSHSCLPSPVPASDVGLVFPVVFDIFADVTRLSRVCSTLVVAALRLANLVEQVTPISFRLSDRLSVDIPPSSSVPLGPEVCWSASSLCRASKDLEREAAVLDEQLNLELSCNHNHSEEVERMKSVNSSWIACAHRILDTVNDLCGSKSQCTFEGDLQPDDFEHSLSSAFKEFSGHLYQSALLDNECNSLRLRLLDLQEAHATSINELQRAQATLNDQHVEIGRYRKHWRCLIDLTDQLIPLISSDTVTTDSLLQLRQGLHEIQNSLVNSLVNQTNDPVLAHFPALAEDSPVTIAPVAARHLELVDAECLAGVGAVPAIASSSVLQQLPDEDAASLASSYRTSLEVSLSSEFNYLKNCIHSLKMELNSMRKYVEASLSSVRDELCSVIRLHDPSNTRSESLLIPSIVVEYIRKLHTILNLNEFVPNADTKLDRISISPTYLCELSKQVSLLQQEVCFTKREIQTSTSNPHPVAYKPDEIATSLGKFGYSPDPSATCNHTDESVSSESKLETLSAFVYACNVLIDYAPTTATGKLLEQVGVTRELIQFLNGILGKMESLCTLANNGNQESTHPASAHSNGLCTSNKVPENILLLDFCARLAVLFDQPTIPLQPINSTDLKTHLSALFSAIQLQKQIFDEVRNTDEFRTAAYTGLINCLDQLCCMSDPKIILHDPHFSSNALSPQSLERLTELIRKGGLKSEDFIPRLSQLHQNVSNLALRISSLTDEDHELSAALRSKEMVFSVPGTVIRDLADHTQSVQSAVEALSTVLDRVDASKLRTGMGDAIHDAQTTGSKTVTSLCSNNQQTTSYLELTVAVDALHKEWTQLKRTLISFERGLEHESVSRLKRGTTVLDTSCEESHLSCANVPSTDDTVHSPLNVSLPTLDVRWPILTCNTHQVLDNPSSTSQLCTVPQERRMSTTNLLASALNLQGWNAKSWPSIHRRAYKKQLPHRSHSLPALRRHSCSPPFVEDPRPTADDIEAIWNGRDKKLLRRASEATLSHHPTVYRSSLLQFVRALEAYFPAFMLRPIGISLFPLSLRTGLRALRHLLLTLPEDLIRPISISDVSDCLECHVQWRELQLWQQMCALRAQLVLLHRQMKLEQASHRSPSELQAQIGQINQLLCQSTLSYKFVHELMPLRIPLHPGGPYCHLLAANVSSDLSTDCEQYDYFGLSATLVQRLLRLLHIRDMEVLYLLSLRQEGGQFDHEHEEICTKLRTFADWNSIPPVDLTELPTYRIGLRMLDSKLFSQLAVSAEEKKRVAESFDFPLNRESNDSTQQHLSDPRHLSSYETLLDCVRRCEHTLSQIQQCLDPRSTFPTNVDVDQLTLPLAQLQSLLRSRKQQTETHVESVTLCAPSTASLTNSPSYPRRSVRPPILNLINAVDHMLDLTELRNLCKHLFDQYRIVSSELELQLDTNWCLRQRLIATNATIDQLSKQLNEEHHSLAYLEQRLNVETEKHTALTEQCDVARVHGRTAVRKLEHLLTGEEQRAIQADSLQEAPVLPTDTTFVSGVDTQAVCGLHGERPPSYLGESRESYHALSASTPLKHSVSSQTTKTSKFSCLPRPMMSCGTARKRSPSSSATPTRTPYRSTKRHQMSLNVPGSSSQVAVQRHRCKPVSSLPSDSTPSLIKRQTNNSNLSCLDPSPAMSSTECISLTTRSIITPDTSAESSESTRLLTDWSFSSVDTQPSGHSLPSAGVQEQSDCSTPAKRPKRSKRLIRLLRHRMFPKTDLKKQS